MKIAAKNLIALLVILTGQLDSQATDGNWKVVIQPFDGCRPEWVAVIAKEVRKAFPAVSVTTVAEAKLPQAAYYPARKRYRAEKILDYLLVSHSPFATAKTRVVGVTMKDISTTKPPYEDWGIFGLAYLGRLPAVVSGYRLQPRAKSEEQFLRWLSQCVIHELGHTFGLEHCPSEGCIMEDAKGTIETVRRCTGKFCRECAAKLARIFASR